MDDLPIWGMVGEISNEKDAEADVEPVSDAGGDAVKEMEAEIELDAVVENESVALPVALAATDGLAEPLAVTDGETEDDFVVLAVPLAALLGDGVTLAGVTLP